MSSHHRIYSYCYCVHNRKSTIKELILDSGRCEYYNYTKNKFIWGLCCWDSCRINMFTNCSNKHFGTFIDIHLPCYHSIGSCYGHYKCIFQCRDRLHTWEYHVYRRQILKYKDGARAERIINRLIHSWLIYNGQHINTSNLIDYKK